MGILTADVRRASAVLTAYGITKANQYLSSAVQKETVCLDQINIAKKYRRESFPGTRGVFTENYFFR